MNDDERIEIRDARRRDFFIVDNVIIDHYGSIIGPFAVLTYVSLCRHADCSTRETYPSLSLIAKELGISRMTVIRSIQRLITHGLIIRKYRKSKSGDQDTNIYIILEPWGSHSQRLPKKTEMLQQSNSSVEVVTHSDQVVTHSDQVVTHSDQVVTHSDQVVTHSDQVVTHSDQGSHSQGLGVVTDSDPNNTQLEQDSDNKTKDPTPTPSKRKIADERFNEFWQAYPRKEAKGRALKVWAQLKVTQPLLETMLNALTHQKSSAQWRREQGKFIPHPATWLNDQRWEDTEYTPPTQRYWPDEVQI